MQHLVMKCFKEIQIQVSSGGLKAELVRTKAKRYEETARVPLCPAGL